MHWESNWTVISFPRLMLFEFAFIHLTSSNCLFILDSKILIILHIFILFGLKCILSSCAATYGIAYYKYLKTCCWALSAWRSHGEGSLLCGIHFLHLYLEERLSLSLYVNIHVLYICLTHVHHLSFQLWRSADIQGCIFLRNKVRSW